MKLRLLILLLFITCMLVSCGKEEEKQGYSDRTFDISLNQDGSLVAKTEKVGNDYKLTLSGSGTPTTYSKKELVPWNAIRKKIVEVNIQEGVKEIGAYFFTGLTMIDEFFLPSSITRVDDNAFSTNVKIFSYSNIVSEVLDIYVYSESAPKEAGKFFKIVEGRPFIWQTIKFLFIGNSFTYYVGTESNPMIPALFLKICESFGLNVEVDAVCKGSHTLTKFGSVTDSMGAIVDEKLNSNQYDYIILQEQSTTPINNYNTFLTAVGALNEKIKATQSSATIYLYETWGSPKAIENSAYHTIRDMEDKLDEAYTNAASEYFLKVTYVGRAFTEAAEAGKPIYYSDNRHPSEVGAYLSALTHAATMLGLDVRKCTFTNNISDADYYMNLAYQIANGIIK